MLSSATSQTEAKTKGFARRGERCLQTQRNCTQHHGFKSHLLRHHKTNSAVPELPTVLQALLNGTNFAAWLARQYAAQIWPKNMILKRLKEATGSRHTALESRLPLLNADMSQARYLQFLQLFWGYYEPLETQLQALPYWNAMGFDYAGRHKTPRLLQDLQALGETPDAIQGFARCQHLPTLASQGQLLGCLYVIEGATLGGQIITRHLQANLGLTPLTGAAFFDGYGARTGSHWKAFCAMLRANADESGPQEDILASANQTFETLGQWLFPPYPTPRGGTP